MALFSTRGRKASTLALAAALMAAGSMALPVLESPAVAQDDPEYSREFRETVGPIQEAARGEAPDYATLKPQLIAARPTVQTADDRYVYGNLLLNIGRATDDDAMQLEGIEMMLDTGKLPAENLPRYNAAAGQMAFDMEDYAKARQRFQAAVDGGFDDPNITEIITRTYFGENNFAGGLDYLESAISQIAEAGGEVPQRLLQIGFTEALNNSLLPRATDFSILQIQLYPSQTTWGDAIAIQRNEGMLDEEGLLDAMRLARAAGAMRDERDYSDYIDFANFRRLPAEVQSVAEEGIAAGMLNASNPFVAEALNGARAAVSGLRDDLGALESDARADAGAGIAAAAGSAFLNFGMGAKAQEMFELALTRPDVDRNLALTRLGIAQVQQGNYATAQETFAQVQGPRAGIAKLWATFAAQESGS